jgi:NhaA family Na+:H+ antiporter
VAAAPTSERPGAPGPGGAPGPAPAAGADGERRGAFARFFAWEAAGSVLLLAATVAALAWANSPWAAGYERMLHASLGIAWGGEAHALTLHHWVNDGLMAVFFFVVGLEIKREVVVGQLSTVRSAALPVVAALGGLVAPALLYAALNRGGPGARGWGVPMATDIAFALGVLALLGRRAPLGLKVFLTALAIADDLGAVLVISLFYTERIEVGPLLAAGGLLVLVFLAARLGIRRVGVYALLVVGVWVATLLSGVHATVAGVLVAMLVPVRGDVEPSEVLDAVRGSLEGLQGLPLTRDSVVLDKVQLAAVEELHAATGQLVPAGIAFEHSLHPVTAFLVLPTFALFNAGVRLEGGFAAALASPVSLGIVLGLFLGKQVGITLASWGAVRLGVAELPAGVTLAQIWGASVLGGIGFTMSIFVSGLALPDEALLGAAKLGILSASALAGTVGYLVLRAVLRRAG